MASLRELLQTDDEWLKYQKHSTELFFEFLKQQESPNDFENWLLLNWQRTRSPKEVPIIGPTTANWAITIAGAIIPVAIPPAAPISLIIVVSLACGAGAKILGDKAEAAIRHAVKGGNLDRALTDRQLFDDALSSDRVDRVVTGRLYGEGGLADQVKRELEGSIVRGAHIVPGLSYCLERHAWFVNKNARVYFAEMPSYVLVLELYEACRHEINDTFKFIKSRSMEYDEATAGQATMSAYWVTMSRLLFESPVVSMIRRQNDLLILSGYALEWDLEKRSDPTLIVWVPHNEISHIGVLQERITMDRPQRDASTDQFITMVETVWQRRSEQRPEKHESFPEH
jgi:hypothetical protein